MCGAEGVMGAWVVRKYGVSTAREVGREGQYLGKVCAEPVRLSGWPEREGGMDDGEVTMLSKLEVGLRVRYYGCRLESSD